MCTGLHSSRISLRPAVSNAAVRLLLSAVTTAMVSSGCHDGILGPLGGVALQSLDSTFQFTYPDLGSDPLRPFEPPPPPRQIGPLLYQAVVVPEDTTLSSDPMRLWIKVIVENPMSEPVELRVEGCTVWPRAYATPARSRAPLWIPGGQCVQEPYTRTLLPAAATEFSFLAHDPMLAYGLPDGRYYFSADFRRANDILSLSAGSGDVRLRVPGLSYRVQVQRDGAHAVRAAVSITNLNDVPTRVTFGDCALSLMVYRDTERTDLVRYWHAKNVCLHYGAVRDIAPGASLERREFTSTFRVETLTQEGLNADEYHLSVALSHNWRTYEFPVGVIEVR